MLDIKLSITPDGLIEKPNSFPPKRLKKVKLHSENINGFRIQRVIDPSGVEIG